MAREVSEDVRTGDWRLFSPKLDDSGATYAELLQLAVLPGDQALAEIAALLGRTQRWTETGLRLEAAAMVLHDLIALGWQAKASNGWLYVRPGPLGEDGKATARRQLEFGRADQLSEPSNRRFILSMERPPRSYARQPVTALVADGRALAQELRAVAALEGPEREAALAGICQPYLQVVTPNARDQPTGLRLMDVWRYFRHGWASRYRSSPGRNLFYLVRDGARPNHPVMGITALGNAVMQLTQRDDAIGWTMEGLRRALLDGRVADAELLDALHNRIKADYSEVFVADLPVPQGGLAAVSNHLLQQLEAIERRAGDRRAERLRDGEDDEGGASVTERVHDVNAVDLDRMTRSPLFLAKRARLVRDLLRTHRALAETGSMRDLLATDEGKWAVGTALRQLKKRFSATSVMEITVCGAVAPYNHLLGGKLACLMMLSPRVRADYADRYGEAGSIIASQMAGRPIVKPPELVFLGTSSLYPGRSSQYSRVRLPAGTCKGQLAEVRYEELGESEGYGSPNLGTATEAALEALAERSRKYRNINFVFGEGQSPKLRQLREGFAALGLNRSNLLNHGMRRPVYGIELARNTTRFLLGVENVSAPTIPDEADAPERIAAFWRQRWLSGRLSHSPALDAVAASTPLSERVSRLFPNRAPVARADLLTPLERERRSMASSVEDEKLAYIRQLYRDESAYSDHVRIGRLRELNVRTPLDDVVRRVVRAGGSVVITGNAGDGKTHTIRLLEAELKAANARVVVDASAETQEDIVEKWREARDADAPFCIAINEGPLIELIRRQGAAAPWLKEVHQQLLGLVTYVPVDEQASDRHTPRPGATVVLDLSMRRTLAPVIVGRVIDKLTEDGWYEDCAACPHVSTCPVHVNRTMLRSERVKARTVELLERVGERGLRATFRELLGFVSYMIFGGRTCADLMAEGPSEFTRYSWLAFEGQGAIFEQIEAGLDPVRQTDPNVDETLWRGRFEPAAFSGHELSPIGVRDLDSVRQHDERQATDAFSALKRRWYFEAPEGRLRHATRADQAFAELQDVNLSSQLRVGRLIALINGWWNRADKDEQDHLRLWTRLAYSPRANGRAMVSGRNVSNLRLRLLKPRLAATLQVAFGVQAVDHLLLAPPGNVRFANLVVDRRLLLHLMSVGAAEAADDLERRLSRFNDALAQHAETGSHVRTIEMLDPESELHVRVRVDLAQRRYDSAQ